MLGSPLRYPGGKQKIAPFITEILEENNLYNVSYVEPYAGGAGVAINLLLNRKVKRIHLNDKSIPIYSFWKTLVKKPEWLCKKILLTSLTIEEWKKQRNIIRDIDNHCFEDIGFAAFYLNRCNRSGILSGGVIGGLEQNGTWKMDARFSRKNLISKIEAIAHLGNSIKVTKYDAEILFKKIPESRQNLFIYCDPPYLCKGEKLYMNHYTKKDHERISKTIQSVLKKVHWVVSYDYSDYINGLYSAQKKFVYNLQYSASKSYLGQELFVFSDSLKIPVGSTLPQVDLGIKNYLGLTGGS